MNRRDFIALTAAVPFGAITFGDPVALHAELLPHRLLMPGLTWPSLAFVGQVSNKFRFVNGVVTDREALRLSQAINNEWRGLPEWFQICLGVEQDDASEQWLMGDGWQQRVRITEAFFRSGGFHIVPQSDGLLLLRSER